MKRILSAVLTLVLTLPVFAQEYVITEQVPTLSLGFQPQSFTYKAAEIDLDVRLSPRNWLTIAPRLQFGNPTAYQSEYSSYYYNSADPTDAIDKGWGLGLTYRFFPLTSKTKKITDGNGPFVSAGLDFLNTDYDYLGRKYLPYTDQYGNTAGYTVNDEYRYQETVSQLGLSVNIGYCWRLLDIMYMEGYLGVGVKSSDYTYDDERHFNLGANEWDTGYSGYYVSSGFRVGIYLNRYRYRLK